MTDFMYSRVPAFNPNTSPVSLARSAAGSVYDIGDTGFTTPLNMTMVATGAVTITLISDANGMFPDFGVADRPSVVFKSGAHKMVLTTTTPVPGPEGPPGPASTVPGPPTTDASLLTAGTVADERLPQRLSVGDLSATIGDKVTGNLDPLVIHRATLAAFNSTALDGLRAGLANARTAPVVIVAAGDSVTFGANATAGNSWVEKLNGYLAAAYSRKPYVKNPVVLLANTAGVPANPGVHVVNAGISGSISDNYLTSGTVPTVAALKPAVVIHTVGFNDWRTGLTAAAYKTKVKTRIDQLNAAATAPMAHLLVHNFEHQVGTGPDQWWQFGQALSELAASYASGVMFIDLSGPFYASGVPGADPMNLLDADLLHPTNAGHELLARLILETLTRPAPAAAAAPPIGSVTYASDTYSGADGALTTTEVGGVTYAAGGSSGGTWSRAGGRLAANKLAVAVSPIVLANTLNANGVVSIQFVTAVNDGMIFRGTDSSNYLLLAINAGVYKLYKLVAGTLTQIAASTVVPAAGDTLAVTLNGSSIKASVNGIDIPALTVIETFNQTATSQGAWAGGSVARTALFDNFVHKSA